MNNFQKGLYRAAKFDSPETIPINIGLQPITFLKYGEDLLRLMNQYPQFFAPHRNIKHHRVKMPPKYHEGIHVDEWGCEWKNIEEGLNSVVVGHPVRSEEDIFSLQIPKNRNGKMPHGFMYLRLIDLCGFEDAMIYFAEEGDALRTLIDKVLLYNEKQLDIRLGKVKRSGKGIITFGDDLGMQKGLAIGAERWRRYMKPCFEKLYRKCKAHNPELVVYMHTDGCIYEIMPDLIDAHVDIINPQYRANGLENLVNVCRRGKNPIAIDLDLDRQLYPFATRGQIFDHFAECVEALYDKRGGLSLHIETNQDIPLENIAALFDAAEKYRHYKGGLVLQ